MTDDKSREKGNPMIQTVHSGALPGPWCEKCKGMITPENSRLRPELFYCDACLPDELKVTAVVVPEAQPAEPPVEGIVLRVGGGEIITHCRARAKMYFDRQKILDKQAAEYEDRKRAASDPANRVPGVSPRDVQATLLGGSWDQYLPTFTNTYPNLTTQASRFVFICEHLDPDRVYLLSMADLDMLEWFN